MKLCRECKMPSLTDIAVVTIYIFLVVVDAIGNMLVIYLVTPTRKKLRHGRDIIVMNMSIADVMVGIFFFPRHVLRHAFTHPVGMTGDWLCKFVTGGNLSWVGAAASSFSIMVLAFERFFAVIYPFKQRFTLRKVKITIIVCWLYAIVFMSPPFFVVVYDESNASCVENWPKKSLGSAFTTLSLVCLLIIPVLIMTFLYGRIIRKLWFTKAQSSVYPVQPSVIKSRKSITKLLLIVTAVYICCWSINITLYVLLVSSWNSNDVIYSLPEALVLLNSAANPVIFTIYRRRFRQQLMRLLGFKRKKVTKVLGYQYNTTKKNDSRPLEIGVEALKCHSGGI